MTDTELVSYFLTNKVNFACSKTACVGWKNGAASKPEEDLFKAIQAAINVGLKRLGKSTIKVDGLIGAGTVSAYNTVANAWPGIGASPVASKEVLAAGAYRAYQSLRLGVGGIFSTAPTGTVSSGGGSGGGGGGGGSTTVVQVPEQPVAPLPASAAAKVFVDKNKWYIAGGIAVLGLGAWLLMDSPESDAE